MGVLAYLDRIRMKPRAVRLRIALVTTLTLWVVIVLMWWVAFSGRGQGELVPISEVTSPWQGFANTMMHAGGEFKGIYSAFVGALGAVDLEGTVEYQEDTLPDEGREERSGVKVEESTRWEAELGGVLLEQDEKEGRNKTTADHP